MDSQEATLPAAGGGPATLKPRPSPFLPFAPEPHPGRLRLSDLHGHSPGLPRRRPLRWVRRGTRSQHRFFGRNPVASREVVRAGFSLNYNPALEALVKDFGRLQPKLAQRGPPGAAIGLVVVRTRGVPIPAAILQF